MHWHGAALRLYHVAVHLVPMVAHDRIPAPKAMSARRSSPNLVVCPTTVTSSRSLRRTWSMAWARVDKNPRHASRRHPCAASARHFLSGRAACTPRADNLRESRRQQRQLRAKTHTWHHFTRLLEHSLSPTASLALARKADGERSKCSAALVCSTTPPAPHSDIRYEHLVVKMPNTRPPARATPWEAQVATTRAWSVVGGRAGRAPPARNFLRQRTWAMRAAPRGPECRRCRCAPKRPESTPMTRSTGQMSIWSATKRHQL